MKTLHGILGLLLLAFAGSAQAVLMTNLLDGGSITIGDKLFDEFQWFAEATSDGHTVNTNNIDVIGLADNGDGYGLRFEILNGELYVEGDAKIDLSFGFHVSVLDPQYQIKDASLERFYAGWGYSVDGDNYLGSYLLEYLGTAVGLGDLGLLDAEDSVLNNVSFSDAGGSVTFAPQSEIWVTKNISVWARDSTDYAALAGFDQRFSQVVVPEPATLMLMSVGLAGLGFTRRKMKA